VSTTLEPLRTTFDASQISAPVQRELSELLLQAGLRSRQRAALAARLGLAGDGARTLAEAGAATGYTHERVRQLEERLGSFAAAAALPATRRALRLAERLAPAAASEISADLARAGLVPHGFQVSGLVRIAEVTGLSHDLCLVATRVLRGRDLLAAEKTATLARRLVRRDGVGHVADLADELGVDAMLVRRLLALDVDVAWLGRSRSWFLVRGRRSRVEGDLRKMLSVSSTLTLAQVDRGLRRARRPVRVPIEILADLCELFPWLVVDKARGTVTLKIALDPSGTHSPVERAILGIFLDHGPSLTLGEVVAKAEPLGLLRMSVSVYVTRMPSLERVARGHYALRGTTSR
jgi:hypothetical protein